MSLINCSECNKEVSNEAESCPSCGNPIKKEDFGRKMMRTGKDIQNFGIGLTLLTIIIILFFSWLF